MKLKITRDGQFQDFYDGNKRIGYQWRGKAFVMNQAGYAEEVGDADTIQEAKDLILTHYSKRCPNTDDLFAEHF